MSTRRQRIAAAALVVIGSVQIVADVAALPRLKALAAATQVAPAMKVFTAHDGYETHAARFSLHWRDAAGTTRMRVLTPATYAGVRGPYNRRNVYGAALAYGPLLRADARLRPLHDSVAQYAFCAPGTLRRELALPPAPVPLTVRIEPRQPLRTGLESSWEIRCDHAR